MSSIKGDRIRIVEPDALTVDTAIYASGDLVGKHDGGKLTFTDIVRGAGLGGRIVQVVLGDAAAQNADLDLVLFSEDPDGTTFTDNAALAVADADLSKIVGIVSLATGSYKAFSANSAIVAPVDNLDFVSADGNLYGALISRGTPTYVAGTDLKLRLVVEAR